MGQQPDATRFDCGEQGCRGRNCRGFGALSICWGDVPGLCHSIDIPPQPIRPHALGFAGQRQHGSASAVSPSVSMHAHVLPTTHVQRTFGAAGWPSIWPQGGPLRRLGTGSRGGGRPGARMMARLAPPWSRDTMLRVLRRGDPAAELPPPARVVGIDDFAWRRGHSYGSIVVDLERRQVIDLLPDRQRDTVIAWLRQNHQVEIICRDRGPGYGAAASEAAPQARQVADRWHLFENASAAFLAAVRSEMPCLRRALAPTGPVDPATLTRAERIQWDGAQLREALNRQIIDLAAQGIPIKAMSRATGVSRQTIRKVLRGQRHDTFRSRESSLDAWSLTLEAEWNAGCRIGAELWRRLKASGFAGSLRVVSEWATRRRRDEKLGHSGGAGLSARTIARSMTTERETGSAQTALINAVIEKAVPALITAREALDRFHAMMRSKDEARLDPWIAMAADTKLAAVAAGVEADKDAIAAAIATPWSSGQVEGCSEGKINRLKAIKRQMFGRAKIDLLKARVMAPA